MTDVSGSCDEKSRCLGCCLEKPTTKGCKDQRMIEIHPASFYFLFFSFD